MTLFRTVEPFPDESLPGLVARAAALNVYPRSLYVLDQAGDSGLRPEAIATRDPALATKLAKVFDAPHDAISRMFHRQSNDGLSFDFFGVQVRSKHREPKHRRVSPKALAQGTPYVRAIWHLRPFTFDPGTKELLISHCPECEKPLGFTITKGIEICEHCGFDMRRHKAPVIEIDDLDAFDFATALVNPLVGDQDALKALSQGDLSHHDRGQLFEMVVALASALMRNAGAAGKIRRDNSSRGGIVGLSPDALTRAARALLSWPQGFVDLCRVEADGLHQRSVYYGKFKELGAVALLRRDVGLDADSRTTIEDGIKRYLTDTAAPRGFPRKSEIRLNNEYAGLTELRKRHGVRASAISRLAGIINLTSVRSTDAERSPVLLPRRMADGILTRYKYLLSEESICYQLGIPPDAVRDLAESSLLRLSTGIEDKLCASPVNYDGMVFEYLFGFFRDTHPVASKMPDYVPLREAMLIFPSGRYPWAPLIWDIMRGDLPSVFNREPPKKGWLGAISVKASCIDESDVLARQRRLPDHDIGRVPISSANLMLGIRNYAVFEACVAAGLLFLDAKKTLAYQDVLAFASKHILTVEISARSQRHGIGVRPWLESHGIVPVLEIPQRGGVYERPIVERRLKALGSEKRTRRPSSKNDGADNLA